MYGTVDPRRILFTLLLAVLALCVFFQRRLPAQTVAPARFTVVNAGKPDVILIPGLNSSHSMWDAEAKLRSMRRWKRF